MKKTLILAGFMLLSSSVLNAQSTEPLPSGYSEVEAYSIFYENYRSDSYASAIKFGRWIWKRMPRKIEGYKRFDLEKNLGRLTRIYDEYARSLEDPSLRAAYLDTTQIIYQKVFTELKDQADLYEWHFNRGRFFQENANYITDGMSKAVADYQKAFELKPQELTEEGNGFYIQAMLRHMVSEGLKQESLAIIDQVTPYADKNLKRFFDNMREQLFDSPEERIAFFEGKLKENPENLEVLKQLQSLYEEEELLGKAQEINGKLYKLDPSLENTRALAEFAIRNANYTDAIKYLKEAISKTDDSGIKAELSLKLSEAYLNNEDLGQSRKYARQAASLKSGWGKPYIQIGDIYVEAVNSCTAARKVERADKAVYWLAEDYFNKAKRVDASFSTEADRKIKAYKPVLPTAEDIHFTSDWDKGKSITIDSSINSCYSWINESTKVR